jgi:hypothetical protein
MNLLGIGDTGVKIVEYIGALGPYKTLYINDKDCKLKKFKKVDKQNRPEDYESNCPRLVRFFQGVKDDIYIFVSGQDFVASSLLAVCEQIGKKVNINIVYIKPETQLLDNKLKSHENVIRNVCQQYARSSLFERMYIFSLEEIDKFMPDGPMGEYDKRITETIGYFFHMFMYFKNKQPILDRSSTIHETARIATFGFVDFEKNEESLFFPLEIPREVCYYFGIDEKILENDNSLLPKIRAHMISNKDEDVIIIFVYLLNTAPLFRSSN